MYQRKCQANTGDTVRLKAQIPACSTTPESSTTTAALRLMLPVHLAKEDQHALSIGGMTAESSSDKYQEG